MRYKVFPFDKNCLLMLIVINIEDSVILPFYVVAIYAGKDYCSRTPQD